ncbi:MAG: radical SAM protein [Alphaproteobacteria bacterium]|nr:radical SAM protein [Alphaproteobacteria bacterium]MCB9697491.1 radical SAM protein [Alphaproteobacteria bacterium]
MGQGTERASADHVYFGATRGLCGTCRRGVDARIVFRDGGVHLEKHCVDHGHQSALMSSSIDWWLDALRFVAPSRAPGGTLRPVKDGCPFDCGPCTQHQQRVVLPVIPVTSGCQLDCPICYTINKNEHAFSMPKEELAAILHAMRERGVDADIINFTGGEPTLHPELPALLRMAREAGFRRLTVSTNGLRLLDESYVEALAEVDARIVLSLDTFDDEVDKALLGAKTVKRKLQVLDLLAKHDVTTTILPAVARGYNDRDVPRLLELVLSRPNLVSLELHTLTFTGQGGTSFDRGGRITVPDLHAILGEGTGGRIVPTDFVPSPLAHPHCYSICYLLMLDDGGWVPLARVVGRETMFALLSDHLYIEPGQRVEDALRDAMDQLWADPDALPETEAVLRTLRRMLEEMFPERGGVDLDARRRVAERATKAIYIHSHMDEETFELSRIARCSVGVPGPDGSNVPTCAYNVLYREKDARFAGRRPAREGA